MSSSRPAHSGFTLIEVAVVLIIGGTLLASFSAALLTYIQNVRMKTTTERIEAIDAALQQYLSINGSLPCPAPNDVRIDAPTFGEAIQTDTDPDGDIRHCDTLALAPPTLVAGTIRVESAVGYDPAVMVDYDGFAPTGGPSPQTDAAYLDELGIRIGDVPVRTLNLPDEYAGDAWNSRFIYAVTEQLTNPHRFFQDSGGITIRDSGNNQVTFPDDHRAQYVIVSVGADKRGGRDFLEGRNPGLACGVAANGFDQENCNNDRIFRTTVLNSAAVGATHYDDIIKIGMQSTTTELIPAGSVVAFDQASCPKGWSPYADAQRKVIIGAIINVADPDYAEYTVGRDDLGADAIPVSGLLPAHVHSIGSLQTANVTLGGGTTISYVDPTVSTGTPVSTDSAGVGTGTLDNRQAYVALNYCRKD